MESDGDLFQAASNNGEKRRGYSIELKKEIIKYAQETSARNAAIRFKIDRKRVRDWVHNKDIIFVTKDER